MFGCAIFGEAFFGDTCVEESAVPALVAHAGGAWYPIRSRRARLEKERCEIEEELAYLRALGYC